MRGLLLVFLFAGVACRNAKSPQAAAPEARFQWPSPSDGCVPGDEEYHLLDDGRLAVSNRRAFRLDYARAAGEARELKPRTTTDTFIDVVRWKDCMVWLRAEKNGKLQLDADRGSGPEPIPRPARNAVWHAPSGGAHWMPAPRLAADGELLVMFVAPWIHSYENGAWSSVQLELGAEKYLAHPARALLINRKLYLGTNRGEFGGQLIVADIDTGHAEIESRKWPDGPSNVTDIDRAPDGTVYVTCGIAHLGGEVSALLAFDGQHWSRLLWSSAKKGIGRLDSKVTVNDGGEIEFVELTEIERDALVRRSIVRGADGTSVASANFRALAFDEQGRLCLLTSWLGILRRDSRGDWSWLTPGWPRSPPWVTDMAIVGGSAVITSPDVGVFVVDLETLAARPVRLRD